MAMDNHQALPSLDVWTSALLTKSSAGRGGNGKLEAYGIKKLRELILELAVRGRLVPQDPSDEPASELLKNIGVEKARLIREGKISKERPAPKITGEHFSRSLPVGWNIVRFGNLISLISGQHLKPEEYSSEASDELIPYLTGPAEFGEMAPRPTRYTKERRSVAEPGDVLITCKGSGVGKTNVADRQIAISRQLMSIRPIVVATEFAKLLADSLEESIRENIVGIAIPGISREDVLDAVVYLPPLAEQHRIVAKVEELMALCDQLEQQQTDSLAAHQTLVETLLGTLTRVESQQEFSAAWARIAGHFDTLFTTETSIDQLKQSILQLAVMGKLVPQDPSDEPASGKLRDFVEFLNGYAFKSEWFEKSGIRLLRNANVAHGRCYWEDAAYLPPDRQHEFQKFSLAAGDLVLSLDRPIINTGLKIARITESDLPCLLLQRVAKVSPISGAVNLDYLYLWFNSPQFMSSIDPGRSNGIPHISTKQVGEIPFVRYSLAEQHRIVAKVGQLMALCDTLKARLADAQTTQLHLADAIVEQAVC